jgi:MsuE subfamily FMN reductase
MRETIEQGVLAEQVGLDVVGIGEHHRFDFIASTPAVILSAIAAKTERVKLISTVTVLSSADPVRTFQDFATLDLISNGRAEIIAGRGSYTDSFPLFGFDLDDYADLYREKLDLLVTIRDNDPVTWSGRFRSPLIDADIAPRPVQAKLPIWVGVGGTPSSAAYAGRMGLPMAYGVPLGTVESGLRLRRAFEVAATSNGHDLATMPTTLHGHGFVARTGQEARDTMYPYFSAGTSENAHQRGHGFTLPRDAFDAVSTARGSMLVGSPQEIIDKLLLLHELYDNKRVLFQMGLGGRAPTRSFESDRVAWHRGCTRCAQGDRGSRGRSSMSTSFRVIVVNGSPNEDSRTLSLALSLATGLRRITPIDLTVIDVYHLGPAFTGAHSRDDLSPEVLSQIEELESADIVIAAGPVFRGSYTGMFKNLFDMVDQYALANKLVILAATGGSDCHALVLEHAMRPLFGFFQANVAPVAYYASAADFDGTLIMNPEIYSRIEVGLGDIKDLIRTHISQK